MDNFKSRFIKGVMVSGAGTFFTIVFGFIGLMVVIRFVPKDQFGVYVLLEVIVAFLAIISDFGHSVSMNKFIADIKSNLKIATPMVDTIICYRMFIVIIIGLITLLSKPLILFIFKSNLLCELVIYISILFLLTSFNLLFTHILLGFHLYNRMATAQIIYGFLKLLLILIFLVILKMDVMGLIHASIISLTISVLFQYFAIPTKKGIKFSMDLFKKIYKFGFPLGLNSILTFVSNKVDILIIGALLSSTGVALYGVALKIPNAIIRLFQSFDLVYFSNMSELFAHEKRIDATRLLNNSLRLISFITISGTLLVMLFQKDIVRLLFSERYIECAPVFSFLMIALNMAVIVHVLGYTLVASGQSDKPIKCNLVTTITNLIGNLIMIPIFGFLGAAYARIFSHYASNPVNVVFLKKSNIEVKISEFIKPILLFGVFWILFLIFKPESIIIKISIICIFVVTCFLLSIVSKKDFSILLEGIRLRFTAPIYNTK